MSESEVVLFHYLVPFIPRLKHQNRQWIILRRGGQTWFNYFYTTYISVDIAHHEIFHAKVGKGGINIERGRRTDESMGRQTQTDRAIDIQSNEQGDRHRDRYTVNRQTDRQSHRQAIRRMQ